LLKKAAALLKEYFGDYEIFRAGGDEFVVIMPGCAQEIFYKKVATLRAVSGYGSDVCLAVGCDWTDDQKNLRLCMHNADEAMYADKNAYYSQHPELHRR
ncbi:MAG: diguanylate cyclase, partial [Treponema sp.]|nr:diguanylate cyclase [Treponema sp.]